MPISFVAYLRIRKNTSPNLEISAYRVASLERVDEVRVMDANVSNGFIGDAPLHPYSVEWVPFSSSYAQVFTVKSSVDSAFLSTLTEMQAARAYALGKVASFYQYTFGIFNVLEGMEYVVNGYSYVVAAVPEVGDHLVLEKVAAGGIYYSAGWIMTTDYLPLKLVESGTESLPTLPDISVVNDYVRKRLVYADREGVSTLVQVVYDVGYVVLENGVRRTSRAFHAVVAEEEGLRNGTQTESSTTVLNLPEIEASIDVISQELSDYIQAIYESYL
jgi:hypothetical protein